MTKTICTVDSIYYIGYGIRYRCKDVIISFDDLSYDILNVVALVNICNRLNLSPLHLPDIVDDFLSDIYFDKQKAANAAFCFIQGVWGFPPTAVPLKAVLAKLHIYFLRTKTGSSTNYRFYLYVYLYLSCQCIFHLQSFPDRREP